MLHMGGGRTPRRAEQSSSCCSCAAAFNRCRSGNSNCNCNCRSDDCPCYTSGKLCVGPCETNPLAADCLNAQLTRCYCAQPPGAAPFARSQDDPSRSPLDAQSPLGVPGAPAIYCDRSRCECYRYREPCGPLCGCQANGCQHTVATQPLYARAKEERPGRTKGCKCSGGKKACAKAKCSCRAALEGCREDCRCRLDCHNDAAKGQLSKATRMAFLYPDQEPAAMIVRLLGSEGYSYQLEFCDSDKGSIHAAEHFYETLLNMVASYELPLQHIHVYFSRSPCFHQDCEPRCEVLTHCESQKSCARLLAVAYGQLQKHLSSAELQLTLRFLQPHLKRGDLYTQQGILAMMEAGIQVEPLTMREWVELLEEPTEGSRQALVDHWADHRLEGTLKQAQHYVNACRRSAGLRQTFWTSGFHDLLKGTAIAAATAQHKLDSVARKLRQQAEAERALVALKTAGGVRESMDDLLAKQPPLGPVSWKTDNADFKDGLPPYQAGAPDSGRDSQQLPMSQTLEALNFSPVKTHRRNGSQDSRSSSRGRKKGKRVTRSSTGSNLSHFLRREKREVSVSRLYTSSSQQDDRPTISAPIPVAPPQVPPHKSPLSVPSITKDGAPALKDGAPDETGTVLTEDEAAYLDDDQLTYIDRSSLPRSRNSNHRPLSQDMTGLTTAGMNDSFLSSSVASEHQTHRSASNRTLGPGADGEERIRRAPGPEELERIVLAFSGRSISEAERAEIRNELLSAVDELRSGFTRLLGFLEQRSSSTPV